MPLYSTGTQANAIEGKTDNEPLFGSEVKNLPQWGSGCSWCYLFVHPDKVDNVSKVLNETFNVFIHTNIITRREKKSIKEEGRTTI